MWLVLRSSEFFSQWSNRDNLPLVTTSPGLPYANNIRPEKFRLTIVSDSTRRSIYFSAKCHDQSSAISPTPIWLLSRNFLYHCLFLSLSLFIAWASTSSSRKNSLTTLIFYYTSSVYLSNKGTLAGAAPILTWQIFRWNYIEKYWTRISAFSLVALCFGKTNF